MGSRSSVQVVGYPWPVVFDALQRCLPPAGYRIEDVDEAAGRITARTSNTRVTIAAGAVDAITTEWVATAERRVGLLRDRTDRHFDAIGEALDRYLAAYYA